jgi:hypothetical protein
MISGKYNLIIRRFAEALTEETTRLYGVQCSLTLQPHFKLEKQTNGVNNVSEFEGNAMIFCPQVPSHSYQPTYR